MQYEINWKIKKKNTKFAWWCNKNKITTFLYEIYSIIKLMKIIMPMLGTAIKLVFS